jgi:hypothetical protein
VNNVTFGSLAVRYGFNSHMLSFSSGLDDSVESFADYQKKNGHQVVGQVRSCYANCVKLRVAGPWLDFKGVNLTKMNFPFSVSASW